MTESWIRPNVAATAGPHELVVIEDAGHLSFTSHCAAAGRATAVAPTDCAPLEVGEDGVRAMIDHAVVAFVRWRFGLDQTPAALDPAVLADIGPTVMVAGSFTED
jgi:hypothetical protein